MRWTEREFSPAMPTGRIILANARDNLNYTWIGLNQIAWGTRVSPRILTPRGLGRMPGRGSGAGPRAQKRGCAHPATGIFPRTPEPEIEEKGESLHAIIMAMEPGNHLKFTIRDCQWPRVIMI